MRVLKSGLIALSALCVVGCVSTSTGDLRASALNQIRAEALTKFEARAYSRFAVARYASLTADPETAAKNYAEITRSVSNDAIIAERALFSALLIGDVEAAHEIEQNLSPDVHETSDLSGLTRAIWQLERGDEDAALQTLERSWYNQYHAAIAFAIKGWILFDTDPEHAIGLQTLDGFSDPLLNRLGTTLAARMKLDIGQTDAALADLQGLRALNARTAMGIEVEARLLAQRGDAEAAIALIDEFRATIGRHPKLTQLRADIVAGRSTTSSPLTAQSGAAMFLYAIGASLADDRQSDVASVYLGLALHLDPDMDAARAIWANVLDQNDRRDAAIRLLRSIPEDSLFYLTAQGQLAWALYRNGQPEDAIQEAAQTLERRDDRNLRVQLADLLQSTGDLEGAILQFDQIIIDDFVQGKSDWRLYFARGSALDRAGEWTLAEADLLRAYGLNPESAEIKNYLGYSWIDRGMNLDEGLELIEEAVLLEPQSGAITDSLGWAHYKLGNFDRAVYHLERATALSPMDPFILDHLGDAYWQVGRRKEAGYQWQRAHDFAKSDVDREVFAQKLELHRPASRLSSFSPVSTDTLP